MPVKRILQLGDPLLWRQCTIVDDPASPEVAAIAEDLKDTLEEFQLTNAFGRGIAAPQIGVPVRLIVVSGPSIDFCGALVNPRIKRRSEKNVAMWDGCFSFSGLVVGVWRAERISVEYTDLKGMARSLSADWTLSQLLQHEIDHLDGILAVQRAISDRHIFTREEWRRQGSPEFVDTTTL